MAGQILGEHSGGDVLVIAAEPACTRFLRALVGAAQAGEGRTSGP